MKDEFSWLRRVAPSQFHQAGVREGIGDDAAVLQTDSAFESVVCVDTMVEGVHFTRDTLSLADIGYKGLAVNVSDIAAMGGIPLYYLVSAAVPKHWQENDLVALYDGMRALGDQLEMDLIGGDTVSAQDALVLSVTVMGKVEKGRAFLRRTAQPGDLVFTTGTLGGSGGGLDLLLAHTRTHSFTEEEQQLVRAHQRPPIRVQEARTLQQVEARIAMNDVSDGIASEAGEIADASGVSLVLEGDKLPAHPALKTIHPPEKALDLALFGGEDFELCGTMSEDSLEKARALGLELMVVGRVEEGSGVYLAQETRLEELRARGYNHFGGTSNGTN
ncbi:thiamine-phosphate kinase [Salsuginibacillus kocurii]|uniref:thiamine-phosphate kinase n=1 Tax=Salsuginibacillus kocurii TaxID=427078 RepID=UPI000381DC09|nr:thiamine-phosphate kinase [Salsuginibacillus kocurii]